MIALARGGAAQRHVAQTSGLQRRYAMEYFVMGSYGVRWWLDGSHGGCGCAQS